MLHTQILKTCHLQAHEVCRIHAYIMHTYCIYISATLLHNILGMYTAYMYTAYVHTCTCYTCMLHACCTHNTSILHACYIHKNWLGTTRMPYKHMKKCMQFVCNCLHAACMLHINNSTQVAYMYSDACDLMCMYVACVR